MKKILISAGRMASPLRGATKSMSAFLDRLSEDYKVTVITPNEKELITKKGKYFIISKKIPLHIKILKSFVRINIQNIWWNKVLRDFLRKNDFELIISHADFIPSLTGLPIKKMIFIREVGSFCPGVNSIDPIKCKEGFFKYLPGILKIQYPLLRYYRKKSVESIKEADLIVSISRFATNITKEYTKKNSLLLNPEIKEKDYKTRREKNPKYLLFVNPTSAKGVDIMYQIAKRLPEKKFLVVGKSDILGKRDYASLMNLLNVEPTGEISDMKEVYKKTCLLINTSRCYEGFGRTPAEAMVNGIPSVVSWEGALPEVIGDAGDIVKDISNMKEWTEKIKKYDDKNYYSEKSRLCKKRIKQFQRENKVQYEKIKKEIGKLIK